MFRFPMGPLAPSTSINAAYEQLSKPFRFPREPDAPSTLGPDPDLPDLLVPTPEGAQSPLDGPCARAPAGYFRFPREPRAPSTSDDARQDLAGLAFRLPRGL